MLPGRFSKKKRSCGGRFCGGVGDRFRRAPLGRPCPRLDGVVGSPGPVPKSSSSPACSPSSSGSSASQICLARVASSSMSLSSLRSPVIVRSMIVLALFRRAERSAFLTSEGVPLVLHSAMAFEGVVNSFLPVVFGVKAPCPLCFSMPLGVDFGLLVLSGGRPRRRLVGVSSEGSICGSATDPPLLCAVLAFLGVDVVPSPSSPPSSRFRFVVIPFQFLGDSRIQCLLAL